MDDLIITAPTAGTIVSRFVDTGEVVNAGTPLLDLVNLDRLYLQVYIPEPLIGRIRLGLPAQVYTDAYPDQPFDATVRYIASEAEFTPKEVQTKDERIKTGVRRPAVLQRESRPSADSRVTCRCRHPVEGGDAMDTAALVDRIPASPLAARDSEHVVEVRGVSKKYKRTVALRDITLDIRQGEVFGFIGPDGSGKSSLIRAIAGVQQYDTGTISLFGTPVTSERSAERVKSRIGLMPQGLGNNLYPELSIDENIDYFAGLRLVPKQELRQRKDQLLAMTRLTKFRDRPMKQLSGGMKQKLGLVCTLIHQPEFVLLDEPTTGVDPVSRRDFWSILTDLVHQTGMTAIISTAYMDEADYMDALALFMDGRIMTHGSEDALLSLVSGTIVSYRVENAPP